MPQASDQGIISVIIAGTVVLLLLAIFIIGFLFLYQQRHNKYHMEQEQLKAAFSQELLKTQIEMQEQTLHYVSQEIHDNITQVLSFVKMNLALTGNLNEAGKTAKIDESRKLVAQAIGDLRDLSKSLSFEHIAELGLVKTIGIEADRLNKSKILEATLYVEGQPFTLGNERELVLFRIFQEALNNALKHSGARQFKIGLYYTDGSFILRLTDDGAGFAMDAIKLGGSGLKNMQNRAALIGAVASISSEPGKGCTIEVAISPVV